MPTGPEPTIPCHALTVQQPQETLRLLPAPTQNSRTLPPTGPLQNRQQQVGQTRFWNPCHHLKVEAVLHKPQDLEQGEQVGKPGGEPEEPEGAPGGESDGTQAGEAGEPGGEPGGAAAA